MDTMVNENAVKALQCADLLLQDLRALNQSSAGTVQSEIEKVESVLKRLETIVSDLNS